MRAAVYTRYGAPDVLTIREVEAPVPGDGEVLVRTHATTVSAVDSTFRKGSDFSARMFTGVIRPKRTILGFEFAGVVEAVGDGVASVKPGDPVLGDPGPDFGAHAELIRVPENGVLVPKPTSLTFTEAAALSGGGLTALPFLRDAGKLEHGKSILIIGASGSVGTIAVQLAKHFEAHVTGVCSTDNVELVASLGADEVVDYRRDDFTRSGKTFDVIFDAVGKSSFGRCKRALKDGGVYLTTVVTLPILLQMPLTKNANRQAQILFTGLRAPADRRNDLAYLTTLVEAGKLKVVVDRVFSFEEIADAHRYVDAGHKKGNVVITLIDG